MVSLVTGHGVHPEGASDHGVWLQGVAFTLKERQIMVSGYRAWRSP